MEFDKKKFQNNITFFLVAIPLIVVICLLSLFFGGKSSNLEESELDDTGSNVTKLVLNEIMTSNKGTVADDKGALYDYVEIYNGHDYDIDLKNYGLSDTPTVKWVFPSVTVKAKSYIVVFLSGTNEEGLHANFKLKTSGGEQIAIFKPNGKIIDAIETIGLEKDTVMARNSEGKWTIQAKPTPGFENSVDGHKEFTDSLMSKEKSSIVINEILPKNKGQFMDSYGDFSGYIEIKNTSDKSINIKNYGLSNSENVSFKYQFPSIDLGAGEVVVAFTSSKSSTDTELHTSFKLNNENGFVVLSDNNGKVVEKVEYKSLGNGMAYIREGDEFLPNNSISPGYPNDNNGIKKFQSEYLISPNDLIINEVMNHNSKYLKQNAGSYYDWVELYNNSGKDIKLSDYYITTNTDNIKMYQLPDVTLKKGEYYILMASGDENLSNSSYKHANFNISDVQSLYLSKNNKVVDSLFVANIPLNYSMGKGKESGIYYFSTPTPGKKNGDGTASISYVPINSKESGIYNDVDSFTVALTGHGTIYYTTDGAQPTTSSKVYSSPLTIKKTTVLRVMAKEPGKLKSESKTYTYIVNENHKISVMSLAITPSELKALHSHAWTEGYQKPVTAQLLELEGGGFEINCGLKLFGGSTRGHAKKSYELKFQKAYGPAKLKYHVFPEADYSTFDSLVLRTGSQDEMGDASKKTLIRDIVATDLVAEYTSVDVQAYRPVAMYLNGKYWGLYFIREKIDETLVGNHYNVDATQSNTDLLRIDSQVKSGSGKKYNKMISYISNNSLSNKDNYNKIKEQIDVENMADFWIAETWTANNDIVNTRYFSNKEVDNGKWKFIFYDIDFGIYNVDKNYYQFSTSSSGMTSVGYSTFLLRNMMKSSEFKKTYLERLSYNLKNTWNPDNFIKKYDDVIKEISLDEIKRNLSRWNMSYSTWQKSVEFVKNFAKKRNNYMVSQAKSYFKLSASDAKKYFGDVK